MAIPKPLCFVLMPFGTKPDPTGRAPIDFDGIYSRAIAPAIDDAGLLAIRADAELTGGIIHEAMFKRLLLCEYAVADLTTANPNVFYELGVRHTARPATTVACFARHQPIPFDLNFLRGLAYDLGDRNEFADEHAAALRALLAKRLTDLRQHRIEQHPVDSPIFQLLKGWEVPCVARLKTDQFRDQVAMDADRKARLAAARAHGRQGGAAAEQALGSLRQFEAELGNFDSDEIALLVDLLLSYRAMSAWSDMIALVERMPAELKRSVLVREQLAFALNRRAAKTKDQAERDLAISVLGEVERDQGASSETCGLLGRIYKDQWDESRASEPRAARGFLAKAIDAYRRGFEADWRDAFPGINLATLLDIRGDEPSRVERDRVLPVVRYAVERRLAGKSPDYWDYATLLEIAVLLSDRAAADKQLDHALGCVRERWEPESTARNLSLLIECRAGRGEDVVWIQEIVTELRRKAAP